LRRELAPPLWRSVLMAALSLVAGVMAFMAMRGLFF
jgi:hypothetical protein